MSKYADLASSGGLEQTVSLLSVLRHPDPGEGGGQEALSLLEDGAYLLRGPRWDVPRADLENTSAHKKSTMSFRRTQRTSGIILI